MVCRFSKFDIQRSFLDVEFAEIDMDVKTFGCNLATDWGSVLIRAQKAAEVLGLSSLNSTSDAKVLIGVIDSGIDYEHPLLRDKIWVNTEELNGVEGVDDDGNGRDLASSKQKHTSFLKATWTIFGAGILRRIQMTSEMKTDMERTFQASLQLRLQPILSFLEWLQT